MIIKIIGLIINFVITVSIVFTVGIISGVLSYFVNKNVKRKKEIKISKKFYLSDGLTSFGKEAFDKSNEWRLDIKKQLEAASNNKVCCFNPNDHFNFLDNTAYESEKEIIEYELYKIRKSDVIIVNFNHPESIGTACELAIAHEYKIPIIGLCKHGEESNLHPWLKEFCNRIFTDREELVLYMIQHYVNEE